MKKQSKHIVFENNKSETIKLDGSLTIGELLKMGVQEVRIVKPEQPLEDNWYRDKAPQRIQGK